MTKIRILLADDHALIRDGLKALIRAEPELDLVGEAADGAAALQEALRLRPDVVVMDVSMPALSGAEATRRLKEEAPCIRVVALSAHEDAGHVRALLEAGARGYVPKRAAAALLIQAIRNVANGGVYLHPRVAVDVVDRLVRRDGRNASTELSEREEAVLKLIAEGYSNKEIAARMTLSIKTIETFKARGMEKLKLDGRVDLVHFALRQGWLAGA